MAFTVKVRGKDLEVKFNYRMMFKANRELGSLDEKGKKNQDGASNLFMRIMDQDDTAIFDLIKLAHNDSKTLKEDEIFDAIEDRFKDCEDEGEAYDELFNDMKEEMLDSGFFMKKLQAQIKNMEKGKAILAEKEDQTSKDQVKALTDLLDSMKNEISSHNVQG